jgi:hypothetical protein
MALQLGKDSGVTETIISGIIVAGLAVTMASLGFTLILFAWQDFQEWRDDRKGKK